MIYRSRCNRAFSTLSLLVVVTFACLAVVTLRANQTWNGIALGQCESQVLAQLGEPANTYDAGTVRYLQFSDMELWLRDGKVFCITMTGDPEKLYFETCVRFGMPVGTWGACSDWQYGGTVARLCEGRLMIIAI